MRTLTGDGTPHPTSPTLAAPPVTHISWDEGNRLNRLRRPDQTRLTTRCGRRAPLDRIDDRAATCADCTAAMVAAAVELLASIHNPRFERGCVEAAARTLYHWAAARVPDDPRIAPDVRDEAAALLAGWATRRSETKEQARPSGSQRHNDPILSENPVSILTLEECRTELKRLRDEHRDPETGEVWFRHNSQDHRRHQRLMRRIARLTGCR